MKYIFSILFLLLTTQTLGHGEHQATDGVIFYVENESGNIALDVTSLAEVREAIQKRRSQKNDSSGYRKILLKDRGFGVAKRAETTSGLPVGQILLVVDDTRLGAVSLPYGNTVTVAILVAVWAMLLPLLYRISQRMAPAL